MNSQRLIKSGGFLIISFWVALALAAPVAGEYLNETVTDTNDPAYWLDQGGLFATYGNFPMAIEAYKKALALDETNSEVYFSMGVAYGEMGDVAQALVWINKAISMDTQDGRYYYGRAWVYLRAGQKKQGRCPILKKRPILAIWTPSCICSSSFYLSFNFLITHTNFDLRRVDKMTCISFAQCPCIAHQLWPVVQNEGSHL